jgi:hypothetical protein
VPYGTALGNLRDRLSQEFLKGVSVERGQREFGEGQHDRALLGVGHRSRHVSSAQDEGDRKPFDRDAVVTEVDRPPLLERHLPIHGRRGLGALGHFGENRVVRVLWSTGGRNPLEEQRLGRPIGEYLSHGQASRGLSERRLGTTRGLSGRDVVLRPAGHLVRREKLVGQRRRRRSAHAPKNHHEQGYHGADTFHRTTLPTTSSRANYEWTRITQYKNPRDPREP